MNLKKANTEQKVSSAGKFFKNFKNAEDNSDNFQLEKQWTKTQKIL